MSDVAAALITGKETVEFRAFARRHRDPVASPSTSALCGICGTDIASFRSGHLHSPAVCGHEWVGVVAESEPAWTASRRATASSSRVPPACGRCPECRRGLGEYCHTVSFVARGRDQLAPRTAGSRRASPWRPRVMPPTRA